MEKGNSAWRIAYLPFSLAPYTLAPYTLTIFKNA